jgi:hypothetical protein
VAAAGEPHLDDPVLGYIHQFHIAAVALKVGPHLIECRLDFFFHLSSSSDLIMDSARHHHARGRMAKG